MSRFPTTRWTLVVRAGPGHTPEARQALQDLCAAYWSPLYAFVRLKGHDRENAQDLVQGFFARFLASDSMSTADRDRGRFRSYLLGALRHYMADEWQRARAKKRGGDIPDVPIDLDFESVERSQALAGTRETDPERAYDRKWALALLDHVLRRLREESELAGNLERYEALIPFVTGDADTTTYREVGRTLDMSDGAARVAVHRLRRRYAELVREEIASTVEHERDVAGELRHLMRALTG